jgi:hypothetical protein
MYRTSESLLEWEDADVKLRSWKEAFTGSTPGPAASDEEGAEP